MSVVVDAGVVCKLLFEEDGSDQAQELLERGTLAAPDLIYSEVGNVIWKRIRFGNLSTEEGVRAARALIEIPLMVADSRQMLGDALMIGVRHGRTVYDSLYVVLALARGEPLVTTDARLVRSLAGTELAEYVKPLVLP